MGKWNDEQRHYRPKLSGETRNEIENLKDEVEENLEKRLLNRADLDTEKSDLVWRRDGTLHYDTDLLIRAALQVAQFNIWDWKKAAKGNLRDSEKRKKEIEG